MENTVYSMKFIWFSCQQTLQLSPQESQEQNFNQEQYQCIDNSNKAEKLTKENIHLWVFNPKKVHSFKKEEKGEWRQK